MTEDQNWMAPIFRVLDESSKLGLKRGFSKEQILKGLTACKRNKAPSSGGFNIRFL